jgi:hypothetical protein
MSLIDNSKKKTECGGQKTEIRFWKTDSNGFEMKTPEARYWNSM